MSGRDIYVPEFDDWRPVAGFPDYSVSASGYICGPGRHGESQLLKPTIGKNGHQYVSLYKDGERHKEYVHRIVATAFIPNPKQYPVVRHLNDCPDDNYVGNLAWGTQQDNVRDMRYYGNDYRLSDEDRDRAYAVRRTPIVAINKKTGEERVFISQQEASRALKVSQASISDIARGKPGRHSEHGYTFRYAEVAVDGQHH